MNQPTKRFHRILAAFVIVGALLFTANLFGHAHTAYAMNRKDYHAAVVSPSPTPALVPFSVNWKALPSPLIQGTNCTLQGTAPVGANVEFFYQGLIEPVFTKSDSSGNWTLVVNIGSDASIHPDLLLVAQSYDNDPYRWYGSSEENAIVVPEAQASPTPAPTPAQQ